MYFLKGVGLKLFKRLNFFILRINLEAIHATGNKIFWKEQQHLLNCLRLQAEVSNLSTPQGFSPTRF